MDLFIGEQISWSLAKSSGKPIVSLVFAHLQPPRFRCRGYPSRVDCIVSPRDRYIVVTSRSPIADVFIVVYRLKAISNLLRHSPLLLLLFFFLTIDREIVLPLEMRVEKEKKKVFFLLTRGDDSSFEKLYKFGIFHGKCNINGSPSGRILIVHFKLPLALPPNSKTLIKYTRPTEL